MRGLERTRQAGEPGREHEGLGMQRLDGPAHEVEVDARIRLHRPGDVGDEHDASRPVRALALDEHHRVAGGPMSAPQRAADVHPRAAGVTSEPAPRAHGGYERELLDQPADQGELLLAARSEVLARQSLALADGGQGARVLVLQVVLGPRTRGGARAPGTRARRLPGPLRIAGLPLAGGRRRRRGGRAAVPPEVSHVDHALEHLAEDRVVGLGLVAGREQRDAAEPVQLVDGGGAGHRDGRPEPGRALRGDGDAGGVQEVAETGHDPCVQAVIGEDARVDAAHPCARIRRPRPRRGPRRGRRPGPRGTSAPIRGSCRPTRHRGRGCPAASPR